MKISIDLLDGTTLECEGTQRTWMCLADRVKFQEKFGVNPAAMAAWEHLVDDEGNTVEGADLSVLREDYIVWFAWRELSRQRADVPDFDVLIEQVVECEVDMGPPTSGGTTIPPAS